MTDTDSTTKAKKVISILALVVLILIAIRHGYAYFCIYYVLNSPFVPRQTVVQIAHLIISIAAFVFTAIGVLCYIKSRFAELVAVSIALIIAENLIVNYYPY